MAIHTSAVRINASSENVFDILTKPELIKDWQFGREVSTSWKTGTEIRFSAELNGKKLEQWGTVLELRTNELIRYNLFTPRPDLEDRIENYAVTTYVLSDENGQTKLEIIQEDNRHDGFVANSLQPILESVKRIAETN